MKTSISKTLEKVRTTNQTAMDKARGKGVHKPHIQAQLDALKSGQIIPKQKPLPVPPFKELSKKDKATVTEMIFDMIEDDVQEKKAPSGDSLKRLVAMGALLVKAEKKVEELEAKLKEATEARNKLTQKDIPDLMGEIGVEEFKLKDGSKIELKKDIACAITDEKRADVLSWLRKNKFSGIIKTAVSVWFAPGEDKEALKLAKDLTKEFGKDDVEKKDTVHPQTLKAFVKERMEDPNPKVKFPTELFNVFEVKKAKLTQPKVK